MLWLRAMLLSLLVGWVAVHVWAHPDLADRTTGLVKQCAARLIPLKIKRLTEV
jgi:hypothetical protein